MVNLSCCWKLFQKESNLERKRRKKNDEHYLRRLEDESFLVDKKRENVELWKKRNSGHLKNFNSGKVIPYDE